MPDGGSPSNFNPPVLPTRGRRRETKPCPLRGFLDRECGFGQGRSIGPVP